MSQTRPDSEIATRPVLLFSGQGSQEAGMGRELAESDASAMALWKEAEVISGLPLREIYWQGDAEAMSDTRVLQPALTVFHCSLWRAAAQKKNLKPFACAGHSLGEFSALVAAGVISPKSALEITTLRGKLMADADPERTGAMAAIVKLDREQVEAIVEETAKEAGELIVSANYNTPVQTVISGAKNAIERACMKVREKKGKSIYLKVSGAFHSALMEKANAALAPVLERTRWRDPAFPVFCNVDGKPATTGTAIKKNIMRQMISPVYWVDLIRHLYLAGARWYMEISPRAVLGKMVGPSLAGIASQCDDLRVELLNSITNMM